MSWVTPVEAGRHRSAHGLQLPAASLARTRSSYWALVVNVRSSVRFVAASEAGDDQVPPLTRQLAW